MLVYNFHLLVKSRSILLSDVSNGGFSHTVSFVEAALNLLIPGILFHVTLKPRKSLQLLSLRLI